MRHAHALAGLLGIGLAVCPAIGQVTVPEVEPNETKALATPATLRPGDAVTGITTGFSGTGVPPANWDYFRIRTAGLTPGQIYRHRLVITSPTPGQTGLIGGLAQSSGVILTSSQVFLQTSSQSTNPSSFVQWYGFGLGEQVYFNIRGGTATTGLYTARLVSDAIQPVDLGSFRAGPITIETAPGFGVNTELFLYNASFVPVAMNDDISNVLPINRASRLQLDLAAGAYYLAVSRFNTANNLPSVGPLEFRNGNVLDFPNALVAEQASSGQNISFSITDSLGAQSFPAIQSEPYQVLWYRLDVMPLCDPATIVTSPTDAEICAGQPAVLQVVASGTAPLSYQWRFNGVDMPGQTSDTMTIAAASLSDRGWYDARVSNACGSALSARAFLDVHPSAPEFTLQPEPETLCLGEVTNFSCAAVGHMNHPLVYQWLKDGQPMPDQIFPQLRFIVTSLSAAGQYSCLVTEVGCGWATSMPAQLTIRDEAPVITLNGSQAMTLECAVDHYAEPGAVAIDDCDGEVPVWITGDQVNDRRIGLYTVLYDAFDSQNNWAAQVSRAVLVRDTLRPQVQASVATRVLWPLNLELVNVGLSASATDQADPQGAAASLNIRVFANEPEVGAGLDRNAPDARDRAPNSLRLRAERRAGGNGRIYLIVASASDASGNTGFAFATVVCPTSQSGPALSALNTQAAAAMATAVAQARTARHVECVMQPLIAQGWSEVGLSAPIGPHQ